MFIGVHPCLKRLFYCRHSRLIDRAGAIYPLISNENRRSRNSGNSSATTGNRINPLDEKLAELEARVEKNQADLERNNEKILAKIAQLQIRRVAEIGRRAGVGIEEKRPQIRFMLSPFAKATEDRRMASKSAAGFVWRLFPTLKCGAIFSGVPAVLIGAQVERRGNNIRIRVAFARSRCQRCWKEIL